MSADIKQTDFTSTPPTTSPSTEEGTVSSFTPAELQELHNLLANASDYYARPRYEFAGRLLNNNGRVPDRGFNNPWTALKHWWGPEELFLDMYYDATYLTRSEMKADCAPLMGAYYSLVECVASNGDAATTVCASKADAYVAESNSDPLCHGFHNIFETYYQNEIGIDEVYNIAEYGTAEQIADLREWIQTTKDAGVPTTTPPVYGGLIAPIPQSGNFWFAFRKSLEAMVVDMMGSERVVDLIATMFLLGTKGRSRLGFLGQHFPLAGQFPILHRIPQLLAFTTYAGQVDFENPVLNIGADLVFVAAPKSSLYGIGAGFATHAALDHTDLTEEQKEGATQWTTLGVTTAHATKRWWGPTAKRLLGQLFTRVAAEGTTAVGGTAAGGSTSTSLAGPVALIIGGIVALGKMGEIQEEQKTDRRILYANQKTSDALELLNTRLAKKGYPNELTNEKVRQWMSETLKIKGADADYTYPNEGLIFNGRREYTRGYRVMLEYGNTMRAYYARVKDVKEEKMTQADFNLWIKQGLPIGSYATPGLAYGIDERTHSLGPNGQAALYVLIEETTGGRVKLTTHWDGKTMEGAEEFRQALYGVSDNAVAMIK